MPLNELKEETRVMQVFERDLPEGPWCGHAEVDAKTLLCAQCGRELPPAAAERLRNADPIAPPGSVWVLLARMVGDDERRGIDPADCVGVLTDRRHVTRLLGTIYDSEAEVAKIPWTQHVTLETFYAYAVQNDEIGDIFTLQLVVIDAHLKRDD
jgi:hypothetical protein